MLVRQDGSLLVGSEQGTARFSADRFIPFPPEYPDVARQAVLSLAETREGITLLGTRSGLVGLKGMARTILDQRDGMPQNEITAIGEAPDGALWLGSPNSGVTRVRQWTRKAAHAGFDRA